MAKAGGVRERILDAALDIAESEGFGCLTQPRIAKAAGVRQSHLTYYFPRKADLLVALLSGSHARATRKRATEGGSDIAADPLALVQELMLDRRRMRFFFGVILGACDDLELRAVLDAHARGLAAFVASAFERSPDDPAVIAFVDQARGIGLRALLAPDDAPVHFDANALASQLGLTSRSSAGGGAS